MYNYIMFYNAFISSPSVCLSSFFSSSTFFSFFFNFRRQNVIMTIMMITVMTPIAAIAIKIHIQNSSPVSLTIIGYNKCHQMHNYILTTLCVVRAVSTIAHFTTLSRQRALSTVGHSTLCTVSPSPGV